MDTTRIVKVSAEDKPAATTANALRIDDGTDEADRETTPTFRFFHLPRELRDEIYDLVAESAHTKYYDMVFEANKQPKRPRMSPEAARNLTPSPPTLPNAE